MRSVFFCIISLLFLVSPSVAQLPPNSTKLKTIKHTANDFTTDRLGNSYLYNSHFIWMYNNKGDSIASFNSRRYGDITLVDATDPYKILVFFQDYNLVLYLDNYLSINGEPIELQDLGYDQISMTCFSRGNGIWIFDIIKQVALHLDENLKVDKKTVNLSQWFGSRIEPNFMIEYNNQLFINEPQTGIYVFDHFGTYQKKLPIIGLSCFQRMDENILYYLQPNYCDYNLKSFAKNCVEIQANKVKNIRIEKSRYFELQAKEYFIYSTK